jgi:hypothetical protein
VLVLDPEHQRVTWMWRISSQFIIQTLLLILPANRHHPKESLSASFFYHNLIVVLAKELDVDGVSICNPISVVLSSLTVILLGLLIETLAGCFGYARVHPRYVFALYRFELTDIYYHNLQDRILQFYTTGRVVCIDVYGPQ